MAAGRAVRLAVSAQAVAATHADFDTKLFTKEKVTIAGETE